MSKQSNNEPGIVKADTPIIRLGCLICDQRVTLSPMNLKSIFTLASGLLLIRWLIGVSAADEQISIRDQTRHDLVQARENAWRAFFQKDPAERIEKALGPEVIAIQESEKEWDNRTHLIKVAEAIQKQGIELLRLEFPRTEIQLFGDTAILYYTYIFETGVHGKSTVDAGRGTEIFVRRDGHWIDVGWHLDNGPFYMKDGRWIKNDDHPSPSASKGPS